MWGLLDRLLVYTGSWNYPIVVSCTTLVLSAVLYKVCKDVKKWLHENNRYIFYAFVQAIYPPLLAGIWIASLPLLYHIAPDIKSFFFPINKLIVLHKIIILILINWFMMRFMVSIRKSASTDYIKKEKMMNFFFKLFYYMLGVLLFIGALNLLGVPFSDKLTALGYSLIIINFVIVLVYFSHILLTEYAKVFRAKNLFFRKIIAQALRHPIKLFIVGVAYNFIIKIWQEIYNFSNVYQLFYTIYYSDIILMSFFWLAYRFTSLVEQHLLLGHLTEKYPDKMMVQTFSKFSRMLIILAGIFIIFVRFNIASVMTFFGGAGIFFGLIGKDIFPNYLSGLVLYIEDRMKVGEWVYSADREVEGTILSMDLRTTTIRTFDKRVLVVPNSLLVSNSVCNASRMTNRRIKETIQVERVSHNSLAKIVRDIRVMLENHPGIDQNQIRMVHFMKFGEYSLNIDLYTFTKTTDWQTYRNVQQDVFLKIMEIVSTNGAKLAFPTRTLQVSKPTIQGEEFPVAQ